MTLIAMLPYMLAPIFFILPMLFFFSRASSASLDKEEKSLPSSTIIITLPKVYPIIGSYLALLNNFNRRIQWLSEIIQISPAATFKLYFPLGKHRIITGNPATLEHILKTHFSSYQKGKSFTDTLFDMIGTGMFNVDGENWKAQRHIASHEFNTKSLRKFTKQVVATELSNRLIPILSSAASTENQVFDLQDILQRFAFDNICKIAFGYDPEYLTPSLEKSKFAVAFEEAIEISGNRFIVPLPIIWKIKRQLNIGSEKRLRKANKEVREFARKIVREKKRELNEKASLETQDLLSRFVSSGHSEEDFLIDIVVSFIIAGKDSTSSALTWFFWLLWKNPRVEKEIMKEISEITEGGVYDEVKEMVYTHATLSESMRLYPPVPLDNKEAMNDDVLPDGTVVKKGTIITYRVYAMGRMESLWGSNWAEFRPERWLQKDELSGKLRFVGRDPYSYPAFQAGPRICLGRDMAFLQMKRLVAGILSRFRVVPLPHLAEEPNFISFLTSMMEGGCPVTVHHRLP